MLKLIISVILVCAGLGLTAQSVKIKADKNRPVEGFKTFNVGKGDVVLVTKRDLIDSVLLENVRTAIIDEMTSRGYVYKSDGTGQLAVNFIAEVLEKQEDEEVGPLGQQPADQAAQVNQPQTWTQVLNQSSLTISIAEAGTASNLWEATTSSETASSNIEEVLRGLTGRCIKKLAKAKK